MIEGVIADIMVVGVTASITAMVTFFVGVKRATKTITEDVLQTKKDISLIKRCLVVEAQLNDAMTKKAHPEISTELESIVKEILKK